MQQVKCFLNGTLDYKYISGDTGPIVYPAGHLYVYTLLYFLTSQGKSIQLGQYFFILLYLFNLIAVFNIYNRVRKVNNLHIIKRKTENLSNLDNLFLFLFPITYTILLYNLSTYAY